MDDVFKFSRIDAWSVDYFAETFVRIKGEKGFAKVFASVRPPMLATVAGRSVPVDISAFVFRFSDSSGFLVEVGTLEELDRIFGPVCSWLIESNDLDQRSPFPNFEAFGEDSIQFVASAYDLRVARLFQHRLPEALRDRRDDIVEVLNSALQFALKKS